MRAQTVFLFAFETALLSHLLVRVDGGGEEEEQADSCAANAANDAASPGLGPPHVYPPPVTHSNYNNRPNANVNGDKSSLVIRPIMRLRDVSVEEFDQKYSPAETAIPLVFEDLMPSTFDPADWTREAMIEECGHIPLIRPDDEDCANLTEAAADMNCHKVICRFQFVWRGMGRHGRG